MRKFALAAVAVAALGSFGLAAPASAAEAQTAPVKELAAAMKKGEVQSDYVQYRRYYRGGPRYVERRYYGPRRYYGDRGYYYRRDRGNALAAGALGLATGAIIGGAIAQSQAQAAPTYVAPGGSAAGYCAQRFKSYDPASGTYLGYDGLRHPCP
ncbi:BA14K family protein [Microvirga calopogonii]|uniref:BA14K family protein n=1 Tax=Microvirga calopogonii TaxID=2078013 RepID=UPI000E0D3535|nr:BA14K family protein [Microvirga calopogonii]